MALQKQLLEQILHLARDFCKKGYLTKKEDFGPTISIKLFSIFIKTWI